ncbi:MICAL-like protein 1 [Aplochiton taeniatus]
MASLKDVHEWCCSVCQIYPNVEIKNMTTSFRDGLAFCAIIHKYRPDLIDFHSLSKHNVYENNQLAFEVAESKLGIRALLDPRDMVSCEVPDCLSVITYLSQFYCFFTKTPYASPASLELSHVTDHSQLLKKTAPKTSSNPLSAAAGLYDRGLPVSVCALCRKQVHLVQRHLIEGKLYHRSCFRCKICNSTLFEGSYKSERETGSLICTHHSTENQNTRLDPSRQLGSPEDVLKLRGLDVTNNSNRPYHYTGKTDSQESLVSERLSGETINKQERKAEVPIRDNTVLTVRRKEKTKKPPPPQPPLRASSQGPNPKKDGQRIKNRRPSPAGQVRKPKDPPWMDMVNPGPWARLPPAPPPIKTPQPALRSSSSFSPRGEWYHHRVAPSNPFGEVEDDEDFSDVSKTDDADDGGPPQSSSSATGQAASGHSPPDKPADTGDAMSSDDLGNASSNVASVETEEHPKLNPTANAPKEDGPAIGGCHSPNPLSSPRSDSFVGPSEESDRDFKSKNADVSAVTRVQEVLHLDGKRGLAGRPGDPPLAMIGSSVGEPADLARNDCSNRRARSDIAGGSSGLGVVDSAREGGFHGSDNTASNHSIQKTTSVARELGSPDPAVTGALGGVAGAEEPLNKSFPKSASVPAVLSTLPQRPSTPGVFLEESELEQASVTPCQSKTSEENPYVGKGALPKSKTFQGTQSTRAAAPGHGFPLIKRKVQTDPFLPVVELDVEKGELNKCLEKLELKGVELEQSLRDCQDDKQEEKMLVDWFTLIHNKHKLVCREAELVYLTKQQMLEERQTDVEYELRCLLNKPVSDWSAEDRGQEQQLMAELVAIIEQRNQIVSGLDQDRQREKEEDRLLTEIINRKDFQKEGLKELKKSKRKFKPMKVLKMLSQKAENTKDSLSKGVLKRS